MSWRNFKPENAANPEDSFGLIHNEVLDDIETSILSLSVSTKRADIIGVEVAKIASKSLYLRSKSNDLALFDNILRASYEALGRGIANYDETVLVNKASSAGLLGIINGVQLLLPRATLANIEDTLDQIRTLEATIAGLGLSADETKIAYWTGSIARYSLCYWINEYRLEQSLWINAGSFIRNWGNPPRQEVGPPRWVSTDIQGAIVGAFFTLNPFTALAGGVLSSALGALADAVG